MPDASACNYSDLATDDAGNCVYPEPFYNCDGLCVNDVDGDGVCDELEVPGCTFSFACNYNPEATTDDGSCEFICTGCTSAEACNYDSFALQDDGSCLYPDDLGWCDCEGNVLDDCSVCGGDGIPAGDCDCNGNQLDALGECGGSCQADADADGICDDVDPCVGEIDACGVCNGPGAVYECGCLTSLKAIATVTGTSLTSAASVAVRASLLGIVTAMETFSMNEAFVVVMDCLWEHAIVQGKFSTLVAFVVVTTVHVWVVHTSWHATMIPMPPSSMRLCVSSELVWDVPSSERATSTLQ